MSCLPHSTWGHSKGGFPTSIQHLYKTQGVSRRELLKAGLAAGVTLSAWPLAGPSTLWGAEAGQPKRGGILRVRGYDPVHFDPHQTISFKMHTTLSFVYSKLVRHKIGPEVRPGTFIVEPDNAGQGPEGPPNRLLPSLVFCHMVLTRLSHGGGGDTP